MTNLIKSIREIIGDHESSVLSIDIYPEKEIVFKIYETGIPIYVNLKEKYSYIDTETIDSHLCKDMLQELHDIVKLIDGNIDMIEKIFE